MGDRLWHAVVKIAHVGCGKRVRCIHGWSFKAHLKVDVVAAEIVVLQVRQKCGILSWQGHLERSQSLGCNNPRADRAGKVLSIEGSEGDVLPNLHISCTPIVQQAITKNVIASLTDRDGISHSVCLANKGTHLELKVHASARSPSGGLLVSRDLTLGASDGGT